MKFHVYKWNKRDKEYTMLILTEEDIENESNKHKQLIPSPLKNDII